MHLEISVKYLQELEQGLREIFFITNIISFGNPQVHHSLRLPHSVLCEILVIYFFGYLYINFAFLYSLRMANAKKTAFSCLTSLVNEE
jgi:hypothetical protein